MERIVADTVDAMSIRTALRNGQTEPAVSNATPPTQALSATTGAAPLSSKSGAASVSASASAGVSVTGTSVLSNSSTPATLLLPSTTSEGSTTTQVFAPPSFASPGPNDGVALGDSDGQTSSTLSLTVWLSFLDSRVCPKNIIPIGVRFRYHHTVVHIIPKYRRSQL